MEKRPNRLITEKSPYLLQHAYNPVDWFPWGDEAFEKAKKENRPIFLSIGYSTCHWCHVMEYESFEDQDVAGLMNEAFISIKVDREERPDLDHIYMTVCQMMTGSGGWPLTILMTPDKEPFFAGTYIPKRNRFGRAGMIELIPKILEVWTSRYDEVLESAGKIMEALKTVEKGTPGSSLEGSLLDKAYGELAGRFDREYGGFDVAPKFPTPHNLLFALRYWKRTGNKLALQMVEETLQKMRRGGIYDQVGLGFHRYSTDREWLVPHFEKMLYDQAMLAMAYLETFQATGDNRYGDTAGEIFTYILRDMTSAEGGFYSAEDADSEGVEGKFYVWEEREIRAVLEKEEAELVGAVYNIKKEGNIRDEASGKDTGVNILHMGKPLSEIAGKWKIPVPELEEKLRLIMKKLFEKREERIHPHKDDKILTDWNGLMIAALATGGRILGEEKYVKAALNAMNFILSRLRLEDGRLLHRYRAGGGITANLDDYAFLVWGLIELYETIFDPDLLETAIELNQSMISHFWDEKNGGFFFTPDDGEDLIIRKKEIYDGAVPSGNSVAMLNLLKLARFTGLSSLEEMADRAGRAFSTEVKEHPSAHTQLMMAIDFGIGPSYEVVIVGRPDGEDTREMVTALNRRFIPNKVTIFRSLEDSSAKMVNLAGFLKHYDAIDDRATAYVCINNSCRTPTTEPVEMLASIE